nr:immunoglobulin heavy chain junction region [Macaca mulatta]MOV55861.1 immunoglobulin heavy chain junction region [Macaca mulatta]MOV56845.1 immunoglobulin heavy chain junction region [Macaca mulatta]MOV58115.1 immunoglobulin heavy chain junction region [Macaca mulatta]MOV59207.1 immunoglobulin heavy chain junction region [Macaca mulatta]
CAWEWLAASPRFYGLASW